MQELLSQIPPELKCICLSSVVLALITYFVGRGFRQTSYFDHDSEAGVSRVGNNNQDL